MERLDSLVKAFPKIEAQVREAIQRRDAELADLRRRVGELEGWLEARPWLKAPATTREAALAYADVREKLRDLGLLGLGGKGGDDDA